MARIEIYIITKKKKELRFYSNIQGASSFHIHIWNKLEEKYLPSYEPKPKYIGTEYYSRFVAQMFAFLHGEKENNPMQEVWNLGWDDRLSEDEKLAMRVTLDNSYIPYDSLLRVADALECSTFTTPQCKDVAKALREIYKEKENKQPLGVYINTSNVSTEEVYDKDKLFSVTDEE